MKQLLAMAALALATASAPAHHVYDLRLKVMRGAQMLATPRLLVWSGEQARFATEDRAGAGWSVAMTPTPGDAAGMALVAVAVEVAGRRGKRVLATQRMTVTVPVKDPGVASFVVPARDGAPGLSVGLALASAIG